MTEKKAGEETPSGGSRRPSAKTTKRGAKAKKADVKRDISHDLIPIAEETWLLQPIAVTMMRHDYSQVQVRILVSIVESLQNILQGMLNGGTSRQLDIFRSDELDEDGRMPIKMPFKELGVSPSHYPQLRNSLKMLASIPVEIPYKTQEGRKYTKATNLCDVYIPEDNSYSKYAILKIDRTVAERLVSFDFGYHRLGKQIVFACKNRYTQRIYMFIASWLDKGKAVIDPLEFRKMLRLEKNYKKFPDFCRRVLDPARSELRSLPRTASATAGSTTTASTSTASVAASPTSSSSPSIVLAARSRTSSPNSPMPSGATWATCSCATSPSMARTQPDWRPASRPRPTRRPCRNSWICWSASRPWPSRTARPTPTVPWTSLSGPARLWRPRPRK